VDPHVHIVAGASQHSYCRRGASSVHLDSVQQALCSTEHIHPLSGGEEKGGLPTTGLEDLVFAATCPAPTARLPATRQPAVSGGRGIRTHEELAPLAVFKSD
jgi:hypothetical protein